MGIRALEMLFLEVDNLEESVDFYTEGLGFQVDQSRPDHEPPMVTLRCGRLRLTFAQKPSMSRRGRGIYFFLTVDGVDDFYESLVARGVEPFDPPGDDGWGGRYFAILDPNGYRLFFVEWSADGPPLPEGEGTELGLAD